MMSRILVFILVFIACSQSAVSAQKRRAVLVGINDYTPTETGKGFALRKWKDLKGAVNDVEAMAGLLSSRFSFDDVRTLTDSSAAREAILRAIDQLSQDSDPGDVALFYYAGHGSQMRNTASHEADAMDETIVPWDVVNGALDIRDKEMRDAFNLLIDKGALVTLIFDSCHSGSITRGLPGGETRYLAPSPVEVSDPSDPPKPVDRGALVLAAAQDDELASELLDENGLSRGAFSWALGKALLSSPNDVSAETLFLQVRALMKSRGMKQEPVLSGLPERQQQPLFGGALSALDPAEVSVLKVEKGEVFLQAGLANGLRPGSELVSEQGTRFRVEQSLGMAQSIALPIDDAELPVAGQVLTIDRWTTGSSSALRLFVPEALPSFKDLEDLAGLPAAFQVVEDPTDRVATQVISYRNASWQLLHSKELKVDLGQKLDNKTIRNELPEAKSPLYLQLPPFKDLRDALIADLKLTGRSAVLVERAEDAEYVLSGRWKDGLLQYAWIHRPATSARSESPLPPRSEWHTVGKDKLFSSTILAQDISKLDVIWGWMNIVSPPVDKAFPYVISGFENIQTGELKTATDSLTVGEQYQLVLSASPQSIQDAQMEAVIQNVTKRFLYVFAVDQYGNGSLLYPRSEAGNGENDINFFTMLPTTMNLPREGPLFTVSQPIGIDSFFLLSSAEPLPQPDILNFTGIRTRSEPEGETSDLSNLLFDLGGGKRSERKPVPLNWSIEKKSVRSVE